MAAHVWYVADGRAYLHLQACTADGYASGASYALFAEVFDQLRAEADLATIGGAAGATAEARDGLFQFKRGWSSATITVPLVGRIVDPAQYRRLAGPVGETEYFPAYRADERLGGARIAG